MHIPTFLARALVLMAALLLIGSLQTAVAADDWRRDSNKQCLKAGPFHPNTRAVEVSRVKTRGGCGIRQPLEVQQIGYGRHSLKLSRKVLLNCEMVRALEDWFSQSVSPTAATTVKSRVVKLHTGPGYVCRTRNSKRGAKISEHGFGNAFDIVGMTLENGDYVSVEKNWPGRSKLAIRRNARFLRDIRQGACGIFSTVLTPDGDKFHQDHMHFDLGRHGRKGTYKLCR
jgi:hypothetical protein